MNKPLVSIGMPVYNGENFMRQALDSLLVQSYGNFELIISDNASTDETAKICCEYAAKDRRIRYYRNEMNIGLINNFYRVFELSQCKYFMWASHDDLWEPEFIGSLVSILDTDPNVSIAFCEFNRIDAEGRELQKFPILNNLQKDFASERVREFVLHSREENIDHLVHGLFPRMIIREPMCKLLPISSIRGWDLLFVLRLLLIDKAILGPCCLFHKRLDISNHYDDPCTVFGRRMLQKGWTNVAYFPGMWMYHANVRKIIISSQLPIREKCLCCFIDLKVEFSWFFQRLVETDRISLRRVFRGALRRLGLRKCFHI